MKSFRSHGTMKREYDGANMHVIIEDVGVPLYKTAWFDRTCTYACLFLLGSMGG